MGRKICDCDTRSSYLPSMKQNQNKIGVCLVGAGYAARGFALQCADRTDMYLASVVNRSPERARNMLRDVGIDQHSVQIFQSINEALNNSEIQCVVEATGDVSYGAEVALAACEAGKHLVVVNAELDATFGPILAQKAAQAGVVYTQAYGDQPAVIADLCREVTDLGLTPVIAGNIKTIFDKYRTPQTQEKWARENNQSPILATNAVDGTKLALEMATVANATGMHISTPGMQGPACKNVGDVLSAFDLEKARKSGGFVDFILGAEPAFGVFVVAYTDNPLRQKYLKMYKMGDGPYYLLYRPYHLCTLETHRSVLHAASGAADMQPTTWTSEVVATAKRDMKAGETLDGIGGFCTYGVIYNRSASKNQNLLPIGLSGGCMLTVDCKKDTPITRSMVQIPQNRQIDTLYVQQEMLFNNS